MSDAKRRRAAQLPQFAIPFDGFEAETQFNRIQFARNSTNARRIANAMIAACKHEGHVSTVRQELKNWERRLVHLPFWASVRAHIEARLEELSLPPKEFDPEGWVVLAISQEGHGAVACCAAVVPADQWEALRDQILALPDREISNETLGGRTSDPWGITTHEAIHIIEVITEPSRVTGFLACFPSGRFGVQYFFTHLVRVAESG